MATGGCDCRVCPMGKPNMQDMQDMQDHMPAAPKSSVPGGGLGMNHGHGHVMVWIMGFHGYVGYGSRSGEIGSPARAICRWQRTVLAPRPMGPRSRCLLRWLWCATCGSYMLLPPSEALNHVGTCITSVRLYFEPVGVRQGARRGMGGIWEGEGLVMQHL